ncbi:hypothetical protein [Serratia ureilytica]|uniref:hypothetical protein n=1 Tax=Serratia ureilytica TaxID=300181 RepID=UPI00384DE0EC
MSQDNRRCIVHGAYGEPEGTFIKYAPVETYDESGQMRTPEKAIVELDSGEVITINPNKIKFIKN